MDESLRWIASQNENSLGRLHDFSSTNSGSQNIDGLRSMRQKLQDLLQPLADECEVIDATIGTQIDADGKLVQQHYGEILRLVKRPKQPRRVLLCGHMDTVFPADSHFQTPRPIDANTLNGPGVADMKGGLLAMALALEAYENFCPDPSLGWEILINADEEIGSHGSRARIEQSANSAEVGLVYEPALADGTMVDARKGSGNFTLVVHGREAHAGREFDRGRNAIAALAQAMTALHELNQHREGIICNLGTIEGGSVVNTVAGLAICRFNVRTSSVDDEQWIQEALDDILAGVNALDGFSAELHGGLTRPPKPCDENLTALFALLKDCAQTLDLEIKHRPTGGCCDGNNLAAAGLPNIDTMGVRGGKIHTDEEFILLDSLTERASLSYLMLRRLDGLESFDQYVTRGEFAC